MRCPLLSWYTWDRTPNKWIRHQTPSSSLFFTTFNRCSCCSLRRHTADDDEWKRTVRFRSNENVTISVSTNWVFDVWMSLERWWWWPGGVTYWVIWYWNSTIRPCHKLLLKFKRKSNRRANVGQLVLKKAKLTITIWFSTACHHSMSSVYYIHSATSHLPDAHVCVAWSWIRTMCVSFSSIHSVRFIFHFILVSLQVDDIFIQVLSWYALRRCWMFENEWTKRNWEWIADESNRFICQLFVSNGLECVAAFARLRYWTMIAHA